jgi:hypothetical protein
MRASISKKFLLKLTKEEQSERVWALIGIIVDMNHLSDEVLCGLGLLDIGEIITLLIVIGNVLRGLFLDLKDTTLLSAEIVEFIRLLIGGCYADGGRLNTGMVVGIMTVESRSGRHGSAHGQSGLGEVRRWERERDQGGQT